MENTKILIFAHIHSLDGEMREATLVEKVDGKNEYICEYEGKRCTAIFNPFTASYYLDDIYGVIG